MKDSEVARQLLIVIDLLNKLLSDASKRGMFADISVNGSEIVELVCRGAADLTIQVTDPQVKVRLLLDTLTDRE